MHIQCTICGFRGSFVGSEGECPTVCPVCKRGVLTIPTPTTACEKCGKQFPTSDLTCPHCGVERLTRCRSPENPQASPQPIDK